MSVTGISYDMQQLASRLSLTVEADTFTAPFVFVSGQYGLVLFRGTPARAEAFLLGYDAALRGAALSIP